MKKVTRQEALELGLKRYDGICKHHGEAEFYTKATTGYGTCVKCTRIRSSKLARTLESNGKTYGTNGKKRRADRNRKWLQENFFSGGCHYCKKHFPYLAMQIEHKKPVGHIAKISKHGNYYHTVKHRNSLFSSLETLKKFLGDKNIAASCANCNHAKSKTLDKGTPQGKREWRKYLREIRKDIHPKPETTGQSSKESAKRKGSRLRHGD